ncbi:MAG: ABC transporter permease [Ardenticatenaceae bacterium]|nr:ABC transporter permease [Ardenticatenaceae bacterium]MCB9443494.1 ABC transporter permease [Ardenticatenaceae bacterium]
MEELITQIEPFLQATIRMAVPLILTGIGILYTERCGILNIGVEGSMLVGTFAAVAGSMATGNIYIAVLCAMLAGGILSLAFAYLTINRRADQLVAGFGINLFAGGLTLTLMPYLNANRTRAVLFPVIDTGFLKNIPLLGSILFDQSIAVWLAIILTPISAWVLYKTTWGLNLRAVGENSKAVATAGLSVIRLRYTGVLVGGLFAGLGGAALALNDLGFFVPNMTQSRGFIVLAALVVGRWNPYYFALVCLLFGAADALQLRAQSFGSVLPYQFYLMLPYLLTIAALAGLVGKTKAPKEYSKPYDPTHF